MKTVTLAKDGRTDHRIVISRSCSTSEKHAAKELKHFLNLISSADFNIVDDQVKETEKEILLGQSEHLAKLDLRIDFSSLGDEGFIIRTHEGRLVIAGGRRRGTLYGTYTFLEKYLGCKWYSSRVSKIPRMNEITFGQIEDVEVPSLEYRDVYYTDAFDADWVVRNKLNSSFSSVDEGRGGKVSYFPFVHSFDMLIPRELYDSHPEYFPLIEGKRVNGYVQRCLSNPDVVKLAKEMVERWIQEHPESNIVSVSQNDTGGWCQCPECSALDEAEGSPSASIVNFVNKIAEEVEKRHPDKFIDTLAYQYSRRPPKSIIPRSNVIIRLCTIECCFAHPIESCDSEQNRMFKDDLKAWSKIAPKLYVWDYVTNFANYLMPFPNLNVLKPNIELFIKNRVKGIFEEGNYSPGGNGEFAELRSYLLAKLLWNPDSDVGTILDDFLDNYYRRSSKFIKEYLELMHENIRRKNIHISIYSPPTSEYLSKDIVIEADELFNEAESIAEDTEIRKRVKIARLPIQYVMIERDYVHKDERKALIDSFFRIIEMAGITHINEWTAIEEYKKKFQ
ncbi:MAG: DUF4838 domain-containing protein [Thermoproteota archaeon]